MRNRPSFEIAYHTDTGNRSDVEDRTISLVPEDTEHMGALFLVADGWKMRDMKGIECNGARITGDTITSAYERAISAPQNANIQQMLVDAFKQANALVYQMVKQLQQEGASEGDLERLEWAIPPATCTAVVVNKHTASLVHVGWCRAYLLRQSQTKQLTEDHTSVGARVRAGMLTPQEARTSPFRNQIYRYIGLYPDIVDVDTSVELVQDDDILLLCTRDLTEFVDDEELSRLIVAERLQESVRELVQLARNRSLTNNADRLRDYHSPRHNFSLMAVKIS